ncbi:hypothetical protein [Pseudobacteroides cellulosolvens]|uniref:Lipoprotein n=1 Tax=Pseudobacteroides cellulosolvens ATCC 35603 = DSM 2933 TaxID=398512 RepID=A0A0L6JI79_9FIRM|nr:hypothetical protein [Pseudobacteroides cellulosolvens]KNY25444.1 hypothetical protein Bccel_0704 [Pseudobacteroides cellulosolvens ATCC 35603 = DSM 2933]
MRIKFKVLLIMLIGILAFNGCTNQATKNNNTNAVVENTPAAAVVNSITNKTSVTDKISAADKASAISTEGFVNTPIPTFSFDKNKIKLKDLSLLDPVTNKTIYIGMSRKEVEEIFKNSNKVNRGISFCVYNGIEVHYMNDKVISLKYDDDKWDYNRRFKFVYNIDLKSPINNITDLLGEPSKTIIPTEDEYFGVVRVYAYELKDGYLKKLKTLPFSQNMKGRNLYYIEIGRDDTLRYVNIRDFDSILKFFTSSKSVQKTVKGGNFNSNMILPAELSFYDIITDNKVNLEMEKERMDKLLGQPGYESNTIGYYYEKLHVVTDISGKSNCMALNTSSDITTYNERYIFANDITLGCDTKKIIKKLGTPTIKNEDKEYGYVLGYAYELKNNKLVKLKKHPKDAKELTKRYYFLSFCFGEKQLPSGKAALVLTSIILFDNTSEKCQSFNPDSIDWSFYL